jgi:rRNA maturation endonuclease Nob1
MMQCYHCGVEFNVKFDDPDARVEYCPSCGVDIDGSVNNEQLEMDFDDVE